MYDFLSLVVQEFSYSRHCFMELKKTTLVKLCNAV